MEVEATRRRSTVETVLRCGLVIVNAFGRPLVWGSRAISTLTVCSDFRTGGGLSKEKAERCSHQMMYPAEYWINPP
eukprot:scaffold5852_cov68-Skeletonema_dohrnii-CCMP3373.AAC.5